jgi:hypothetical protein
MTRTADLSKWLDDFDLSSTSNAAPPTEPLAFDARDYAFDSDFEEPATTGRAYDPFGGFGFPGIGPMGGLPFPGFPGFDGGMGGGFPGYPPFPVGGGVMPMPGPPGFPGPVGGMPPGFPPFGGGGPGGWRPPGLPPDGSNLNDFGPGFPGINQGGNAATGRGQYVQFYPDPDPDFPGRSKDISEEGPNIAVPGGSGGRFGAGGRWGRVARAGAGKNAKGPVYARAAKPEDEVNTKGNGEETLRTKGIDKAGGNEKSSKHDTSKEKNHKSAQKHDKFQSVHQSSMTKHVDSKSKTDNAKREEKERIRKEMEEEKRRLRREQHDFLRQRAVELEVAEADDEHSDREAKQQASKPEVTSTESARETIELPRIDDSKKPVDLRAAAAAAAEKRMKEAKDQAKPSAA